MTKRRALKKMFKQLEEMTGPYCSGLILAVLIDCLNELVRDTDRRELRTLKLELNDFFSVKYDFRNRRVVESSFIPEEQIDAQRMPKNN